MALGTIVLYLGMCVLLASPSALMIVVVLSGLLLIYIRQVEEQNMLLRFGDRYAAYRKSTPFLIPRFSKDTTNGIERHVD